MAASAEIYFEHARWGRALSWSVGLHIGVTLLLFGYSAIFYRTSGDTWGAAEVARPSVPPSSAVSRYLFRHRRRRTC